MQASTLPAFVSADTSVISRLTSVSPDSVAYNGWIAGRLLAIGFQVKAELINLRYGSTTRSNSLSTLVASCVHLGHSEATSVWYARVSEKRQDLRKTRSGGWNAGDADMWVISSALEHGLGLLSHDDAQVKLARAMGLETFTNLPNLRVGNPQ